MIPVLTLLLMFGAAIVFESTPLAIMAATVAILSVLK